jgi:hypothetical protein
MRARTVKSPHSSRSTLLLALGLLLAPAAQAQTEIIALHPCHLAGVKDPQVIEETQAMCAAEMARDDVQLVRSDDVRAFLDKEPKKSCAVGKKPAECLGRLATATKANRAVLITVTPGQLTRVSGLVVDPKGELLDQKNIQIRSRGEPPAQTIRTAVSRLIEQLNLVPVKLAPLVEQQPTPPAPVEPPPTQSPTTGTAQAEPPKPSAPPEVPQVAYSAPPRSAFHWRSPVLTYAGAGVAGAGLVLAGVFTFLGNDSINKSNTFYEGGNLPTLGQLPQVSELRQKASTQRTIATVSAIVGGAALVGTGAQLWFKHRGAAPAPGATALSVGPGGVSVQVLLP